MIEVETVKLLWKVDKTDLAVYAGAFLATLFLGIAEGILIGAAISLARIVKQSAKPTVAEMGRMVSRSSLSSLIPPSQP